MDSRVESETAEPDPGGSELDRSVVWRGLDAWRSEVVAIALDEGGIVAEGCQVAVDPMPYRLDYRLEAREDFVTRGLSVEARGSGWWRRLELRNDREGNWSQRVETRGSDPAIADPGGDLDSLHGAIDCDLGLSPLTNLMPIRRSGLDRHPGAEDFLMAWVSVPDLGVVASSQRYEHVRTEGDGSVVRYVDRGLFPGFEADLRLDASGVVLLYPGLGERVDAERAAG